MKGNIKLRVIMAGDYKLPTGKRIDFSLDQESQIPAGAGQSEIPPEVPKDYMAKEADIRNQAK